MHADDAVAANRSFLKCLHATDIDASGLHVSIKGLEGYWGVRTCSGVGSVVKHSLALEFYPQQTRNLCFQSLLCTCKGERRIEG